MITAPTETITGRLGIGSICLLALFFAVDSKEDLFAYNQIEMYGKTATFSIIVALPTIVITYILGIFSVGAADMIFSRFRIFILPSPESLLLLSQKSGELLQNNYSEHIRNFELLEGTSIAFILLATGVIMDRHNLLEITLPGLFAVVLFAIFSAFFAYRSIEKAREIA